MTTETQFHPLDFDVLDKGDFITPEQIAEITNTYVRTRSFDLARLALQQRIEKELHQRGNTVTVKQEHEGLRILNDAEASEYNDRKIYHALRSMHHRHFLHSAVDVQQLDDKGRQQHERAQIINGKMIQAARGARRNAIKMIATERSTPKMIEGTTKE